MEVKLDIISVGENQLDGTLLYPAEALPGILFVHGWGGSQEQDLERARKAAGIGAVSLTFDLRGHEPGSPLFQSVTREQNLRDLLAAYDRLAKQPNVDASSIAVIGVSYGGYLAAILTSMRRVRWLALRSPAIYKDDEWDRAKLQLHLDQDLPVYRRREIKADDNRALRACAGFTGDALLIQAEHDGIVPHEVGKNYVAAFSKAKSLSTRIVAGANHAFSEKKAQDDYTSALISWLTEMIVGGRGAIATARVEEHKQERARSADSPAAAH
jgi:pimeloyl-ACP methyl ester carboxylesterase